MSNNKIRFTNPNRRSQSCRVSSVAHEIHRDIVDRAQRRFEEQLAKNEEEFNWILRRRRDLSLSSTEKRQANEHLKNLRTTLNENYSEMMQVYLNEHKKSVEQMNEHLMEENQSSKRPTTVQRQSLKDQRPRVRFQHEQSVKEILKEHDALCQEKLATQKTFYTQLLHEQAERFQYEQNRSKPADSNIRQLKDRLNRMESEHQQLKQLVADLRNDLSMLSSRQRTYRTAVHIPDFLVES